MFLEHRLNRRLEDSEEQLAEFVKKDFTLNTLSYVSSLQTDKHPTSHTDIQTDKDRQTDRQTDNRTDS